MSAFMCGFCLATSLDTVLGNEERSIKMVFGGVFLMLALFFAVAWYYGVGK